jgi:hypothetical protein
MKKDRKQLELELHKVLLIINTETEIKEKIINLMKERHNYTAGEVKKILNETIQLEYLSLVELCVITTAINEVIGNSQMINGIKINAEDYFNPPEILNALQVKKEIKTKDNILVFDNVIQVSDRQWVCVRSFKQLAEDMLTHKVTYNFETQRDPIEKIYEDTIIRIPNIIPGKVNAIKQEIKSLSFTPNLISYNILQVRGDETFSYNSKESSLTVELNDYTEVDAVDGANRLYSVAELISENPDFEGNMIVNILHYNVEEARHFIRQEQLAEPISKEKQEEFNMNDYYMTVVKEINRSGNAVTNEMFNRVASTPNELKLQNKYTTLHILREAISQNFKFNNAYEATKIKNHIINVMNYVIGYFRETYGNIDEAKKEHEILNNNMFYVYIAIAKSVYGKDDWEMEVGQKLQSIDFSKNNPLWQEFAIDSHNITKRNIKNLVQHFAVVNE